VRDEELNEDLLFDMSRDDGKENYETINPGQE